MKRVQVNAGTVALVFQKGDYKKVLTQGSYWLKFSQTATIYNLADRFHTPIAIELLLEDTTLASMLDVVDVKDNEIVLLFEKGNFKTVLEAGQYIFWKGLIERT